MANEIAYELGETGRTVYAVARNAAGQAWNGSAFVTYTTTRDTFDLPLAEIGTTGSYGPINLPGSGDRRWWQVYLQAGASPSHSDDIRLVTGYDTVGSLAGHTPQTADHTANIAAIVADTNELQTDLADGGRLDLILDARASQASVNTINGNVDTLVTRVPDIVSLASINAQVDTAIADAGLAPIHSGTATAGDDLSITLDAGASSIDGFYVGHTIYITDGPGAGQSGLIGDYNGTSKLATIYGTTPFDPAMGAGSEFKILPLKEVWRVAIVDRADSLGGAASVTVTNAVLAADVATQASVDTVDANVDSILTRTDVATSSRASQASVDSKASQASVDTVDSNVDSILADTNELQTDWANGGRLDNILDAASSEATAAKTAAQSADGKLNANFVQFASANTGSKTIDDVGAADLSSVTTAIDDMKGASFSAGTDSLEAIRDRGDAAWTGSGGIVIPVSQIAVPLNRLWIVKSTPDGLRGELPLYRTVGDDGLTFAIDFRHDLPANGRLTALDVISMTSGTAGGIVISADLNDRGVDRSQAKFKITSIVTAGTYEITAQVSFDDGAGGGIAEAVVTLVVRESTI